MYALSRINTRILEEALLMAEVDVGIFKTRSSLIVQINPQEQRPVKTERSLS
jgi:hypothetical protein